MTSDRLFPPVAADVEPSPLAQTSTLTGSDVDRCRDVLGWQLAPLLETIGQIRPELGAELARTAVMEFIPLMNAADTEALLKTLARKDR